MHKNPEKIAWSALLIAFLLFVIIAITLPIGTRLILINSTKEQKSNISLGSGSVYITRPAVGVPEALFGSMQNLTYGTHIETENASRANMSFFSPDNNKILGTVQLYGDTEAKLLSLTTPRFKFSKHSHDISLMINRGRLRSSVSVGVERNVIMTIHTPQAEITLHHPGNYSVEVINNQSLVSVREGMATVSSQGKTTTLIKDERTTVESGQKPAGKLSGQRNIIDNGSFSDPLSEGWTTYQNRQNANESAGVIEVGVHNGRRSLHFLRRGLNWAETGIKQELGLDVSDYQNLRLHLAAWLAFQDLRNCGSLGSECPLMVRIEYIDTSGNTHEWLQG
ncbi:MAG TPA: hypothetical protein DGM69_07205, partial [Chloroflexi bacterium]|nr:hypothetical protein [Chloroflexota bacterium]